VQRPVELTVAATVEAVAVGQAGRSRDGCGAGHALDDLHVDAQGRGGFDQVLAVAAVHPDLADARAVGGDLVDQGGPGDRVLDGGGGDQHRH